MQIKLSRCFVPVLINLCLFSVITASDASENQRRAPEKYEAVPILVSWKGPTGKWYFSVRLGRTVDAGAKTDLRNQFVSINALKRRLLQFPTGTGVFWCSSRRFGFEYPKSEVVKDVQTFASKHGIDVELNPSLVE
jgi:hypothetical protein